MRRHLSSSSRVTGSPRPQRGPWGAGRAGRPGPPEKGQPAEGLRAAAGREPLPGESAPGAECQLQTKPRRLGARGRRAPGYSLFCTGGSAASPAPTCRRPAAHDREGQCPQDLSRPKRLRGVGTFPVWLRDSRRPGAPRPRVNSPRGSGPESFRLKTSRAHRPRCKAGSGHLAAGAAGGPWSHLPTWGVGVGRAPKISPAEQRTAHCSAQQIQEDTHPV